MHVWDALNLASSVLHLTSKNMMSRWWQTVLKSIENVPKYAGRRLHWCQWTASFQSSFATFAHRHAMHVPKNVKDTMLTIARDVHKHAATAPKNVEEWLPNRALPIFCLIWTVSLLALLRSPPPPTCVRLSSNHERHDSCYCRYYCCGYECCIVFGPRRREDFISFAMSL